MRKYTPLLLLIILAGCCSSYDKGLLRRATVVQKNPKYYYFNSSIKNISDVLKKRQLFWTEIFKSPNDDVMQDWRFTISEFRSEFVIDSVSQEILEVKFYDVRNGLIGKSLTYYGDSGPLDFWGTFCVKLEKIDTSKTKVSVTLEDMGVLIGRYYNTHCFCCAYDVLDVEPSGVEEYLFLYHLGKIMGEANMPEPIIPVYDLE